MNNINSFGHCSGGVGYIQAEKKIKRTKQEQMRTKKRDNPKAAPNFIRTLLEAGPEFGSLFPLFSPIKLEVATRLA